ncbi:hypothetical protein TWF225_004592 [Orbilia oligospora]|uniref:Uncharacterized protein n=1 Tax=Orbilia oligospora TaxID=2813651 RepID=A0A7C8PUZ1_ORBOL|nr:hypothetical protein TWF751_010918 [Orbilia oligospora]KAF3186520.1 hypothetical protein TWF225_004592 [Orbilia oligospora]KAF3261938.1 hypothetical protein TWF217_004494 [Orbilia oligospora]KAF3265994.1 hypothetical protein TWF128_011563 [Orbilia oligospora]KAF3290279.1 hypothetical protein TWF132_007071 [Orbilia oligospora]
MASLPVPSTISRAEFQTILSRYSSVLKAVSDNKPKAKSNDSQTLEEIDGWRDGLSGFASQAKTAKGDSGGQNLNASQVKGIVLWKLKRGKFRPTILPLVNSNPVKELESTVNEALNMSLPGKVTSDGTDDDDDDALAQVSSMMKVLIKLKGIGPATATAILSSVFPETIPMFSDEAFRWIMMDKPGISAGWNRNIAYNAKEYSEFFKRVRRLCRKFASEDEVVNAGSVEKVGWVLGQEAALGITHRSKETPTKPSRRKETEEGSKEGVVKQEPKQDNILSSNGELSKSVTDGLETIGSLSKTSAKRKPISAEISPPLRRSKRNKEA